MEAIDANTRQESDRKVAEHLLAEWAEQVKTQKESGAEKKAIEADLLELAERHPEWFDGKTATLANGKLKWTALSKIVLPENFDMERFRKKWPHLVKVTEKVEVSKVRAYLGDQKFAKEGVRIESEDRFKVEAV